MPYFKDATECDGLLGGFFREVARRAGEGEKTATDIVSALKEKSLIIKFIWKEPELSITLDPTQDPLRVLTNDNKTEPVATFSLTADTAHEFWHGKIKLAKALTTKQIVAKGPIPKILKLLPIIEPLYKEYPKYLAESGREDLVLKE
jgi:hypothetical protein